MNSPSILAAAPAADLRNIYLHPGQLVTSTTPCVISTILGSCVAVCMWDEDTGIGGMNHFLLPHFAGNGPSSARFGNVAVEQLVSRLLAAGARRYGMRAKLFGGANVLEALRGIGGSLGRSNVEVARRVLKEADIPVVAEDVEGDRGRKVLFQTNDGSARVKLLAGNVMSAPDYDLDEVLTTFLAETEEQFSEMEEALVALESQPDDHEAVQTIFRAAHTLKGNAASMGYAGVADIAHHVEDLLDRLREGEIAVSGQIVTALLRAIDALRFLVPEIAAGRLESHPAQAELIADLVAASSSLATRPAAARVDIDDASTPFTQASSHRTLRVDLARLDRMLDLSGEIAVAQGRLAQMLRDAGIASGADVLEAQSDANRIFMDLQEEILRARMVPLGPTFRQQIRTVRDAAQAAGKVVRLEIEGEDVEVDTTIVEQLRGPITHMIRNSVDHGIELPEDRVARGKNTRGTITLRARHESGGVVIELKDDGAGLDLARIGAKAKALGMVANPEGMDERELVRLVFEPGFSTSETVTELSGRGVGMDVVRKNVEALRGSIDVRNVVGEGATFSIRVPLTVAIIQGFLVESADETYVIPLEAVAECVDLPEGSDREARTSVINLRGEPVPYLRLRQTFGLSGRPVARESLVVVTHGGRRAALAVDTLVGESQVVIKPFSRLLRDMPGLAGSTILGSGRVALILDVPALLNSAQNES